MRSVPFRATPRQDPGGWEGRSTDRVRADVPLFFVKWVWGWVDVASYPSGGVGWVPGDGEVGVVEVAAELGEHGLGGLADLLWGSGAGQVDVAAGESGRWREHRVPPSVVAGVGVDDDPGWRLRLVMRPGSGCPGSRADRVMSPGPG